MSSQQAREARRSAVDRLRFQFVAFLLRSRVKVLQLRENDDQKANEKNVIGDDRPEGRLIQPVITVGAGSVRVEILNATVHVHDEIISSQEPEDQNEQKDLFDDEEDEEHSAKRQIGLVEDSED